MESISQVLAQFFSSPWELLAVLLAISYLLLAMYENSWCWLCAFISTAIYTVIFWDVNLFMDSALQVYYLLMAIYGWYQWCYLGRAGVGKGRAEKASVEKNNNSKKATNAPQSKLMPISRWSLKQHLLAAVAILLATLLSGYLLQKNTTAAWPYLDSFTTWASVLTTYMVAKKILENWLYWIVIDSVAAALYIERGLYPTALLFMLYVVIVIFGFIRWRKQFQLEQRHA